MMYNDNYWKNTKFYHNLVYQIILYFILEFKYIFDTRSSDLKETKISNEDVFDLRFYRPDLKSY